ncbi:hypothetical protein BSKO_00104 [Bryopsis sp. KO-2023]|nr:hypothetical protein BSKO_00104 [Bryopsis sp. KO-2023]
MLAGCALPAYPYFPARPINVKIQKHDSKSSRRERCKLISHAVVESASGLRLGRQKGVAFREGSCNNSENQPPSAKSSSKDDESSKLCTCPCCVQPTPGPGHYSIGSSASGPAYSFPTRQTTRPVQKIPGPGQYDVCTEAKAPAFTMARRFCETAPERMPGPGNYSPEIAILEAPAYTFGSKENKNHHTLAPGPGHYEARQDSKGKVQHIQSKAEWSRNQMLTQRQAQLITMLG